jgi:hypothetical protein
MKTIAMLTAIKPGMNETMLMRHRAAKAKLMNHIENRFKVTMFEDESEMFDLPNDIPRVSKVVRIRNQMVEKFKVTDFDYVFWLDADIVEFKPNTLSRLWDNFWDNNYRPGYIYENGPMIIAATPLIEETEKFYDHGAFIQRGTSHIVPDSYQQIWGRNVNSFPPYFHPGYEPKRLMEMDSVAQCVLMPSFLYIDGRHSAPNAFYEFWPLCEHARSLNVKTYMDTQVVVYHANFPLYTKVITS